ncbi:MAG TPA: DPP IV N-terminal domain-containing protein, partial [Sediminibacterium sp.]|nr:DPP IV N-terminal domain-containing protein [Sediminibacterium sp.]
MKRSPFIVAVLCFVLSASAQQKKLSEADYTAAASLLAGNTQQYIDNGPVRARWNQDNSFWYRNLVADGAEFILVDPVSGKRAPAFDHQKMADALKTTAGISCTAHNLPFTEISFSDDRKSIMFTAGGKGWKADLGSYTLSPSQNAPRSFGGFGGGRFGGGGRGGGMAQVISPDGKKAAFIRDNNLWVRDIATRKEKQLTTDGVTDFGYATHNAGWTHSNGPILRWSPDSRKIATFQQDERNVGNMYLVSTQVGHPELQSWKYPLPGDKTIITIQRVIIDVDQPKVIRLQVAPDPHRASLSDDISSSGTFDDVDWNADASQLAFVSTSRDHKIEKFRIADAATGAVREVFTEEVPTQYESGQGAINWRYLAATHEIIWYSERDNWGHLYLYDAETGKPKNLITKGDFVVTRML